MVLFWAEVVMANNRQAMNTIDLIPMFLEIGNYIKTVKTAGMLKFATFSVRGKEWELTGIFP
jgi:hypothetical protein